MLKIYPCLNLLHCRVYVCMYVCILGGKTGNNSDSMKIYRVEKTQILQKKNLFIKSFANLTCFGFKTKGM